MYRTRYFGRGASGRASGSPLHDFQRFADSRSLSAILITCEALLLYMTEYARDQT